MEDGVITLAGRPIGAGHPCRVVAELGINHNGSVQIAEALIDAAVAAGADAVKLQKRTVEVVYMPEDLARPRESPFGTTNGDLKRALEFDARQYAEIDAHCRARRIPWFASAWDVESVAFLDAFDVPAHKVASACLTDLALIAAMTKAGKPLILSTGMSTPEEIAAASRSVESSGTSYALLVTTATYPAPIDQLHLRRLATLQAWYPQIPIGYSGHETGLWTTLCAVAMGASIVERHLTLDRSAWGTDHAASLEPHALKKLIEEIRSFERAAGSSEIRRLPGEAAAWEKLRRVK